MTTRVKVYVPSVMPVAIVLRTESLVGSGSALIVPFNSVYLSSRSSEALEEVLNLLPNMASSPVLIMQAFTAPDTSQVDSFLHQTILTDILWEGTKTGLDQIMCEYRYWQREWNSFVKSKGCLVPFLASCALLILLEKLSVLLLVCTAPSCAHSIPGRHHLKSQHGYAQNT